MEHLTGKEITHLLTDDAAVYRWIENKTTYQLENSQFQSQNHSQTPRIKLSQTALPAKWIFALQKKLFWFFFKHVSGFLIWTSEQQNHKRPLMGGN